MKKCLQPLLLLLVSGLLRAQEVTIYPSHWFADMQYNNVQLILKAKDTSFWRYRFTITYPGVQKQRSYRFSNGKYVGLDISISKDAINKFDKAGRTIQEQEAFDFVRTLALFRKKSTALTTGKTTQFLPSEGVYVYFRHDDRQTVMCIINTNNTKKRIELNDYTERTKGFTKAVDIFSGKNTGEIIELPAQGMMVLELLK